MQIYSQSFCNQNVKSNTNFRSTFVPTKTLGKAFSAAEERRDKHFLKAVRKLLKDKYNRKITVDSFTSGPENNKIYEGTIIKAGTENFKIKSEPIEILNDKLILEPQDCEALIGQDSRLAIRQLAGKPHDRAVTLMTRRQVLAEIQKIRDMIFKQQV